jgi:hypothetical protein
MVEHGSYRPRARTDGLHIQPLGDELLVFDRDDDRAHSLNETAAKVWQACDGTRDLAALGQACGVDGDTVEFALELLRTNGLLDEPAAPATFSRRTLLGAAVALPVVISVAAPTAAMAASTGGAIALCYVEGGGDAGFQTDVQAKLMGTGRFSSVTLIDCSASTPSVSTLQNYSAVLTWSDSPGYANATTMGNNLATYAGGGGIVVVAVFALGTSGDLGVEGAIVPLLPFVQGNQTSGVELTLVADLPSSPLLTGVSSFDGGTSSYNQEVTLASGATQVAHWSNGTPLVAYLGNVVGLNFWPPSSDARGDLWKSTTNGATLMANALRF